MTRRPAPVLYRWPEAAAHGRVVPKSRIYDHTRVAQRLRDHFVAEVQRITWSYKLAETTVNLPATEAVPEIQVFSIEVKGEDVADAVLETVDRAIPFPIVFEINRVAGEDPSVRTAVVYAHRAAKTTQRVVYSTDWGPTAAERIRLPQAINLAGLYAALVAPLLPVSVAPGEELAGAADRAVRARTLAREIRQVERRMRAEPQFNRKVELRRQVRELRQELDQLQSSAGDTADPENRKEPSWRS